MDFIEIVEAPASPATPPYSFFDRIGRPKYITAPMVDHSELSYRMLTRKYGATLTYTQMFSSNCFSQSQVVRDQLFQTCAEDRPLIVQFAGHDPAILLEAAKHVEDHCDAVDINLGCPQGIAKRGRYGAFLMEELDLLHDLVSTLVKGLKIPVTCKTRIYRDDFDRSIRLCETLVNAGASMLTIHGRAREEKGNLVADADWTMIKRIKEHFGDRVPIIANGGIANLDDVHRCLEYTGVDGVMSSEAILENPALFLDTTRLSQHPVTTVVDRDNNQDLQPLPSISQQATTTIITTTTTANATITTSPTLLSLAEEYLQLVHKYPHGTSLKSVRQHLMKFLYKYFLCHEHLRNRAGDAKTMHDYEEVVRELKELVGDRDAEYTESWYLRHRSAVKGNGVIRSTTIDSSLQDQFWKSVDVEECGDDGLFTSLWG